MSFWHADFGRLAALIAACSILSSVETLVPLFRYERGRFRRALPNLVLALAVVGMNVAMASVLAAIAATVTRRHFGLLFVLRQHRWALLLLGVASLDLFAYFAHLLLHKSAIGWRFHRVHHSEMEVDVTTAFRQHPGESVWRTVWLSLGIAVLGLPFWVVPVYLTLSSLNALAEHANVRMSKSCDAWLRTVIVTPNMHKIHHSRRVAETDSNYSNIFSIWDRVGQTYIAWTDYRALRYGLDGFEDENRQTLTGLVIEPFRRS